MITFDEAVEKVFQHRGPLAGAAETETHWLFSPSRPDNSIGPTLVNRETGEIEQYDTNPKNWRPVLKAFRAQEPTPQPIPTEFYEEPEHIKAP
ncbi:peptidase M23 [Corynebacterium stationis]|uniref:peptidase M23 n=1 Tax=Corynebacterium stationis TaxID=1705 RepID=UPI00076F73E0|nr:peptidase M23 [Corynebacterium stationis]AMJ43748.1 peptidase M23 [Corynebacterium stationis]AQX70199.1 peptidase M23 [Corynebacterium stationis]ASJ17899.1 peptidase M23 [Corynebacterium stationis]